MAFPKAYSINCRKCRTLLQDHITLRLCDIHWLPVRSRIKYKILVTTYRALHNEALAYISEMLTPSTPPRTLRSTNTSLLTVLTAHTKQRDRTFSWAAPRLWNKLSICIKNPLLPKKVVLECTESLPGLVLSEYLMASPTVNSACSQTAVFCVYMLMTITTSTGSKQILT